MNDAALSDAGLPVTSYAGPLYIQCGQQARVAWLHLSVTINRILCVIQIELARHCGITRVRFVRCIGFEYLVANLDRVAIVIWQRDTGSWRGMMELFAPNYCRIIL